MGGPKSVVSPLLGMVVIQGRGKDVCENVRVPPREASGTHQQLKCRDRTRSVWEAKMRM